MSEQAGEPVAATDAPEAAGGAAEVVSARRTVLNRVRQVLLTLLVVPLALGWELAGEPGWPVALIFLGLLALTTWRVLSGPVPAQVLLAGAGLELGICVWIAFATAGRPGWALVVVGTLAGAAAVLSEQPLNRLTAIFVPEIASVPDLAPAPPVLEVTRPARLVRTGLLLVGLLVGLGALPTWCWLLAGLGLLVIPGLVLARTIARLVAGRRINRALPGVLTAYAPEFVVYTSRPDAAAYQVAMWLPYLERTGRRYVIIARSNVAAAAIMEVTDAPVITRQGAGDLEACLVDSLRAAFYVNASSGNGALVRYPQLTHVYLGHGDSDKPPSYNPTHAMYDRVFAAGPAAIERYAAHGVDIPREKFDVVGRPQVETVEQARPGPPQVALYAPTWRGHVAETLLYSLPVGERIVQRLLDRGLTVIFRAHPFSYDFPDDAATCRRIQDLLAADAARTGRAHRYGAAAESEIGIIDCINASDLMVTDISSVVSDYLFSGKPLGIVAVPTDPDRFVVEYPVAESAYVISADLSDLDAALDAMTGDDPRRDVREAVRSRYLGDFPARGYAQAFVDACHRVITGPRTVSGGVDDSADDTGRTGSLLLRIRTQFAAYGRDLAAAALAVLTLVVLAGGARSAGLVVGGLTVLLVVVLSRRVVTGWVSAARAVASLLVARVLLVLATLALWREAAEPHPWWALLPATLLVLTTAAELPLRAAWAGSGAGVRNLGALGADEETGPPRGLLVIVNLAQLVLTAVGAVLGLHPLLLLPSAVAAVVVAMLVLRAAVRRAGQIDAVRVTLRDTLVGLAPRFAVYFASPVGADYQVGMWLPYFRRLGLPWVLVTRNVSVMNQLAEMAPEVPVVFRPTLRSLEDVVVPSLTTAFYVNNAVRNTHFIERRELTHVWLNHGDSEKPACFNPVHAVYDLIFSAGQAGIDRYARHGVAIGASKFRIVGRPQVEQIEPARAPIATITEPTVLYAPTWRGPYADSRVYSLPQGPKIVAALLERGVRVVFRAHPFNYRFAEAQQAIREIERMLTADRRSTGRQHLFGPVAQQEMSIEDCFNASDAMIADVSAVVSDYLKSDKPFSIVSVGRRPEQLLDDAPAAAAAYVLREDLTNLDEVYDQLLRTDPLREVRSRTRRYYLGDFDDQTYADGFLDAARTVIDTDHP